jgi:hypothetical protein
MITQLMIMQAVCPPGFEGPPPRAFRKGEYLNVPLDITEELAEKYVRAWIAVDATSTQTLHEGTSKWTDYARRVQAARRKLAEQ